LLFVPTGVDVGHRRSRQPGQPAPLLHRIKVFLWKIESFFPDAIYKLHCCSLVAGAGGLSVCSSLVWWLNFTVIHFAGIYFCWLHCCCIVTARGGSAN
jgi:hypothetical protein